MQISFSGNFSIHWQIWKLHEHPALQVTHPAPWPSPPALLGVTFYMTWGGCPQMMVALKYKWASEKPVGDFTNPTSLQSHWLQLLKFLTGNLQWVSAWEKVVPVFLNQEAPNSSISSNGKSAVLSGQPSSVLGKPPRWELQFPPP